MKIAPERCPICGNEKAWKYVNARMIKDKREIKEERDLIDSLFGKRYEEEIIQAADFYCGVCGLSETYRLSNIQ